MRLRGWSELRDLAEEDLELEFVTAQDDRAVRPDVLKSTHSAPESKSGAENTAPPLPVKVKK